MTQTDAPRWRFGEVKPVIGMLHLPALPGSPRFGGDRGAVRDAVLRDAEALAAGGVDGLMMENFGDTPFFKDRVPAHTVSHMTRLAEEVRRAWPDVPLGVNVLRNDVMSALAIADAVGGACVRVNVLSGAVLADQGIIESRAAEVMRYRSALGAADVAVWADVAVKHAAPLAARPLEEEARELVGRAMADALIMTGSGTGRPTSMEELAAVKTAAGPAPVLVGSGVAPENIRELSSVADGFIVGSSLKHGGRATEPVDRQRVRALMEALAG